MGYTTAFTGRFELDKPLRAEHRTYLNAFANTRHMQRDREAVVYLEDPIRKAAGLWVGEQGGYYVGGTGKPGGLLNGRQDQTIVNPNLPPLGQPGLWCHWEPSVHGGGGIEWSGDEKFEDYVEWLQYLIDHFLRPWGYVLSGRVAFEGDKDDDRGWVVVKDHVVTIEEMS